MIRHRINPDGSVDVIAPVTATDATPAAAPASRADWPAWAATIATLRQDDEQGVGDTFARIAASSGAATVWRAVLAMARATCGCEGRRSKWNRLYRYSNSHPSATISATTAA